MKELFETLELEFVLFSKDDVITASISDTSGGMDDGEWDKQD